MNRRELLKRALIAPVAAAVPVVAEPVPGSFEWIFKAIHDAPPVRSVRYHAFYLPEGITLHEALQCEGKVIPPIT